MVGHTIRYAIENGFEVYDFGGGDESYKYSFGAQERFAKSISIHRLGLKRQLKNLVPTRIKKFGKILLSKE
jgi:CelD/BcsL family acetyltransferase involved in cellulose biosynthesis